MLNGIKSHGNNLMSYKIFDPKYCCSNYYNISVNKYKFECGASLRFWESNEQINSIDPYGQFR